jgi:hypothetical protein
MEFWDKYRKKSEISNSKSSLLSTGEVVLPRVIVLGDGLHLQSFSSKDVNPTTFRIIGGPRRPTHMVLLITIAVLETEVLCDMRTPRGGRFCIDFERAELYQGREQAGSQKCTRSLTARRHHP